MSLNILFCGSPEFSCYALKTLIQLPIKKTLTVITQPDKIRKRGNIIQPTPVKALALNHDIPVISPNSKEAFEKHVTILKPDIIIVIAYAMIIPKSITDSYFCVNAHTSLLPKYRGASPIQSALLNQEKETGICLIHMNERLDEGPIINSKTIPIQSSDTFGLLHDQLATLSAIMIQELIEQFMNTPVLPSTPQDHSKASYCTKIKTSDCELNPSESLHTTYSKIKAYSPKPGAYIIQNDKKIKILNATIESDTLIPTQVQAEGKKQMSYSDYLLGNKPPIILC